MLQITRITVTPTEGLTFENNQNHSFDREGLSPETVQKRVLYIGDVYNRIADLLHDIQSKDPQVSVEKHCKDNHIAFTKKTYTKRKAIFTLQYGVKVTEEDIEEPNQNEGK